MSFDPELLRAFCSVAASKGFTAAARDLNRTQSTVSFQIKRLEEIVGRPLLLRTTRAVSLTTHGELFLDKARRILRLQQEAMSLFHEDADLAGTVRLGVTEDFASGRLASLLADFKREARNVRISIEVGLTQELRSALDRGEVDVVLGKTCAGNVDGTVLWIEPLAWTFAKGRDPEILGVVPLALFQAPCVFRHAAIAALDAAAIAYDVQVVSRSFAALRAVACAGLAVTVLPRNGIDGELAEVVNLPPLPHASYVMHVREGISPSARRLTECLRKLGRLPGRH